MRLKPVIASYSGASHQRIRQYLDENVLKIIASVALSPKPVGQIPEDMLHELVDMHVLAEEDNRVRLDTAVFLEADILSIIEAVTPLAHELAGRILECGAAFRNAPSDVTLFLGGILGYVQGTGRDPRIQQASVDWKNYTGKYAQSKVDFDEICNAYQTISPDLLNKSVSQGERTTTVFIGPGGAADPERHVSSVITRESIHEYEQTILAIGAASAEIYARQLPALADLLRSTTSSRQGMPPANGMLHLNRYIRRLTAHELCNNGFFQVSIPETGNLSVIYENDIPLIKQLL